MERERERERESCERWLCGRQARGPQTVDGDTGEAKEVEAITVMNVIEYPTPVHELTTFNEVSS